jgi:hypothetical protein
MPRRTDRPRTRVTLALDVEDYEWVKKQPGLEFSAILARGIHHLRAEQAAKAAEEEVRDYLTARKLHPVIAQEVKP